MTPAALASVGAGLVLGLAGSGHCALMCGPLVLLSRPREATPRGLSVHVAAYHAGRLASYAALGAAFGVAGATAVGAGWGRALTFVAASALVAQAVLRWRWHRGSASPAVTQAIGATGRWMRRHPVAGPAAFGAMTGLLPCGLVYGALTAALGLGAPVEAAWFMLAFGAGSLPLLAAIGVSGERLRLALPAHTLRRSAPIGLILVALMLMLRGVGAHAAHTSHAAPRHPSPAAHHHETGSRP